LKTQGDISLTSWQTAIEKLMLLIAPSVPHMAEELWAQTGHTYSIHNQKWPAWQENLIQVEQVTLVVQINGKLRDRISVPVSISEEAARKLAFESPRIKPHIEGKQIVNAIYVPGKLVNLVVK
jgi:leucyl-tRNA synthetase